MSIKFIYQPRYPIKTIFQRKSHTYDNPDCWHDFCGSLCIKCAFSAYLKQVEDSIDFLEPMDA